MILNLISLIRIVVSRGEGLFWWCLLKLDTRVSLGSNVRIWGTTFFEFDRRCTIIIGENTLINGSPHGYHLSQYRNSKIKCKNNSYLKIVSNCRIHGALIHAGKKIEIDDNVLIASGVQIKALMAGRSSPGWSAGSI